MIAFLALGELGVLGANPFRGGAENRAKGAKDAKVKGKKDEEIARVVVDWAFALGRVILDLSLYLPRTLTMETSLQSYISRNY
jgi:hypothetical protein